MVESEGVVYVVPVPNEAPPEAAAYQLMVPDDAVAPKLTVPVPHLLRGVVPVMVGFGLTVAVTVLRRETQSGPLTIQL